MVIYMIDLEVKLIRHATGTHMDRTDIVIGRALGAELTDQGRAEAIMKGVELRSRGITPNIVMSSPALRCRETGRLALNAMRLDIPIQISPLLHEMDMGEFVGIDRETAYNEETQAQIKLLGNGFKFPGGESITDVSERGLRWLDASRLAPLSTRLALAFTHGGFIANTVAAIEGWDRDKAVGMRRTIEPVSETSLVRENGTWHVDTFAR
jgi:broad specificity phosphatase PhoE